MISALYVDPAGPYPELGLDCWDEARDARSYAGPNRVIAHPPCARWSAFARLNQKRYGIEVGSDGGCFRMALSAVDRFGGVLEHPAGSLAWKHFGLRTPQRGRWIVSGGTAWVTEVSQSAYGHRARKRTWLYLVAKVPRVLDWSDPEGEAQIGWFDRIKPTLSKREACLTPPAFAQMLVDLVSP